MSDVEPDGRRLDRNINIPESENVHIPAGNFRVLTISGANSCRYIFISSGDLTLVALPQQVFTVKHSDDIFLV